MSPSSLSDGVNNQVVLIKYVQTPLEDGINSMGRQEESNKFYMWPTFEDKSRPLEDNSHFQIVWSQLSFKVKPSIYDKAINLLLNKTQTFTHSWQGTTSNPRDKHLSALSGSDERTIFENLNGYVNSGEITAILGPSGAGKTSFLDALSGRSKNYAGRIQLMGAHQREQMRLSIIPQKDYLIESLTVRENLLYSSKILNPEHNFDHESNIIRVVGMLNLAGCFNSLASNISGGEYKRVSIAQELLRQPEILILDEPTSGLDSLNCKNLIMSLKGLIEASRLGQLQPIAIVLTIHQPDVDIFHMFDHIYCMARGGRVIFDGRPGDVLQTVRSHAGLNSLCQQLECNTTNPANLLIEIGSEIIYGQDPIERLAKVQRKQWEADHKLHEPSSCSSISDLDRQSDRSSDTLEVVSLDDCPKRTKYLEDSDSAPDCDRLIRDKRLQMKNVHSGLFWYHTRLLTKRSFAAAIRDPLMTIFSLVFHLSIPFVMWMIFPTNLGSLHSCPLILRDLDLVSMVSNQTVDRLAELTEGLVSSFDSVTLFFITTYAFSMCGLAASSLAFPLSMHILLKEVRNGWYESNSFVIAKTLANFPFEVIYPVVSLVMIYLLLGMPPSVYHWRLIAIALTMALVSMISHTEGLIFGALCMDSIQAAVFMSTAISLPQILLSGYTGRIKNMPPILQALSWSSLYRYSTDLISIVRFGFGICPCDESTEEYLLSHEPSYIDIPSQLRPLMGYYLRSGDNNSNNNGQPDKDTESFLANSSSVVYNNATEYSASAMRWNLNESATMATGAISEHRIPGVDYSLTLSETARSELLHLMDKGELDVFGRMAELTSRAFSYGRDITNCRSMRSQLLTAIGTPEDDKFPIIFAAMLGFLVICKIILFLVVRKRVRSRL